MLIVVAVWCGVGIDCVDAPEAEADLPFPTGYAAVGSSTQNSTTRQAWFPEKLLVPMSPVPQNRLKLLSRF